MNFIYFFYLLSLPFKHIVIENVPLTVELADNEESRRQGLMFRRHLPEGAGMLFIFEKPQILDFWQKNTLIPLSIAFFDQNRILLNIEDMPSCYEQKIIKHFKSITPALYALEVPRGWFKKYKIRPGMKFSFQDPSKSVQ